MDEFHRTECAETGGGKKKKEKIIASIRYDESGDDEWRRLANVG